MSEDVEKPIEQAVVRLETDQQPGAEELCSAPTLEDWEFDVLALSIVSRGTLFGHEKFADGSGITTSEIVAIDRLRRWIRTKNTLYRLGRSREQFPLLVQMALQPTWYDAYCLARWASEEDPLCPNGLVLAAGYREPSRKIDWALRRATAQQIAELLTKARQYGLTAAWQLLATDASNPSACEVVYQNLKDAADGIELSPALHEAIAGWERLATGDTDGEETDDPIAAARHIGVRIMRDDRRRQPPTSKDLPNKMPDLSEGRGTTLAYRLALCEGRARACSLLVEAAEAVLIDVLDPGETLDLLTQLGRERRPQRLADIAARLQHMFMEISGQAMTATRSAEALDIAAALSVIAADQISLDSIANAVGAISRGANIHVQTFPDQIPEAQVLVCAWALLAQDGGALNQWVPSEIITDPLAFAHVIAAQIRENIAQSGHGSESRLTVI